MISKDGEERGKPFNKNYKRVDTTTMKLLMSKNGGERRESPSLMKNYYKKVGIKNVQGWREERGSLLTKKNYQKQ